MPEPAGIRRLSSGPGGAATATRPQLDYNTDLHAYVGVRSDGVRIAVDEDALSDILRDRVGDLRRAPLAKGARPEEFDAEGTEAQEWPDVLSTDGWTHDVDGVQVLPA